MIAAAAVLLMLAPGDPAPPAQPKSAAGWTTLGLAEFRAKNYDLALQHLALGKSLGLAHGDPISHTARYHRAILETHFGRFQAALEELKGLTAPALESPAIIQATGVAALQLRYLPHELPAGQRALVMATGRAVYDSWSAQARDASREFRDLLVARPDNASLHYTYGFSLLGSDRPAGLRELRKALDLDPYCVPALLSLAVQDLLLGDLDEGLEYAQSAARLDPDSFTSHEVLGRLLVAGGDLKRGTAELETAVQREPECAQCHFALASAYTQAVRLSDAEKEKAEFLKLSNLRAGVTTK